MNLAVLKLQRGGLSKKEERECWNILIKGMKGFIYKTARKYSHGNKDDFNCFLNVGTSALIETVNRYDASMGTKFSSYAIEWIRAYVDVYALQHRTLVHIPANISRRIIHIHKNNEEIPEEDQIHDIMLNKLSDTIDPFSPSFQVDKEQRTFNAPCFTVEILSMMKFIEDKILSILESDEKLIVQKVNGYKTSMKTLREVGDEFGKSHEWVRRKYNVAIGKLQTHCKQHKHLHGILKDYLQGT